MKTVGALYTGLNFMEKYYLLSQILLARVAFPEPDSPNNTLIFWSRVSGRN